jgi:hypothetical protein
MPAVAPFLLGFAVMAAYWPGIAGAATTPRWIVIGVGAWLLFFFADRVTMTLAHVLGLVFLGWCVLTLSWSVDFGGGIGELLHLIALAGAFALASTMQSLRPVLAGASMGLAISSAIVIAQWLGWNPESLPSYWSERPAALFVNANYLGEAAGLVIVGCMGYRLWTGAIIVAPSLLLSGARGAVIAVGMAAAAWIWTLRSRWHAVGALSMVAALLLGSIVGDRGGGVSHRLAIWSDSARSITMAGHGLGSFWEMFPRVATSTDLSKERPERAHNELLDAAFEVGVIGAIILLGFAASLSGPFTAARFVLVAIAVEAVFAFPFHMPATAFMGALVAGHCARDRHNIRAALGTGRVRLREGLEPECVEPGVIRRA